jgi:hypothetical protein
MDVAQTVAFGGVCALTRRLFSLLAAGMLLGLLAPSPSASSFTIVQPTEKYAGKIYGQWSTACGPTSRSPTARSPTPLAPTAP